MKTYTFKHNKKAWFRHSRYGTGAI